MKSIVAFFLIFSAAAICFAQSNQTESLTITTYYPSPYGIYRNLKFTPTDVVPSDSALSAGVIYYNNTDDVLRYYNKTGSWVNLTGGGGGGYWAYNPATKDIHNTNPGKVIVDGVEANNEIFQVRGDVRLKNPSGNTSFYLGRFGASSTSSPDFEFNTWMVKDSWDIGSQAGTPSTFVIGNHTIDNNLTYEVAVNAAGNVGLRTDPPGHSPLNASAKLHIVGDETGGALDQSLLYLEGDGSIKLGMESASNTPSRGPEIRTYRGHGSLAPGNEFATKDGEGMLKIKMGGYPSQYGVAGDIEILSDAGADFSPSLSAGEIVFYTTQSGFDNINQEPMKITEKGQVGIGGHPDYWFFNVHAGANNAGVGPDGHWVIASDKRLKNNISGIDDALAKIVRVQGVQYDFMTETSSGAAKGRHLGFIGQDLEKEFPELVSTDSKGYKSVGYEMITPVLVEAIKEQQEEINSLRKEIGILKLRKKQGHL